MVREKAANIHFTPFNSDDLIKDHSNTEDIEKANRKLKLQKERIDLFAKKMNQNLFNDQPEEFDSDIPRIGLLK